MILPTIVSALKKLEGNFTQSNFKKMDKQQSAYGVLIKQLYQCWKRSFSFSGALSKNFSTYRFLTYI